MSLVNLALYVSYRLNANLFFFNIIAKQGEECINSKKGRRQIGALLLLGRRDSVFESRLPY